MDTIEKLINRLPEKQCEFVSQVRSIILSAHPEMTEKLTFSTPFFSCRQWLCYFNILDNGGLEVGFCKGHLLTDSYSLLIARNRKVVRSIVYESLELFDEKIFREYLEQAITLNLKKMKIKTKANKDE